MRGNESGALFAPASLKLGFQIPMRGNEDYTYQGPTRVLLCFKSP